jgi:hypothetical protein
VFNVQLSFVILRWRVARFLKAVPKAHLKVTIEHERFFRIFLLLSLGP